MNQEPVAALWRDKLRNKLSLQSNNHNPINKIFTI